MKLKLTDDQVMTIIEALDLYSRVSMGQFNEILFVLRRNCKDYNGDLEEPARKSLRILSSLVGLENHGYYAIFSNKIDDRCRRAYIIEKVLQKYIAQKTNMHSMSVWHDGPMTDLNEPLPKIEDD